MNSAVLSENAHWERYDSMAMDRVLGSTGLDMGQFNIEEYWEAMNLLEASSGLQCIRMDFGVPGLAPRAEGLVAQQTALFDGKTPVHYPPSTGLPRLNASMARFVSNQLDVDIDPNDVFVTCGATQALFVAQAIAGRLKPNAEAIAFLTPNYPPMTAQARFLDKEVLSIEVDARREDELLQAIRDTFESRNVAALCWASPSNPGWMVLTDRELKGVADLCREFGVIPIEDLTYLGMVNSVDTIPQGRLPSIARYSDDYCLVLSASKMLSYAGERVGFLVPSANLLKKESRHLEGAFGAASVRRAVGSFIFNTTAGAPHTAQYAVASVMEAINRGELDLHEYLGGYIRRAQQLAVILQEHGFYVIQSSEQTTQQYGFYVSFGFPGLNELELLKKLLSIGVSVLPLSIFGSERRDGVRACVGRLDDDKLPLLNQRLRYFM